MTNSLLAVMELVSSVLEIPVSRLSPDASMETVAEWDSLAQLNICMVFAERFKIKMEMSTIAEATSIAKLSLLLD